MEVDPATTQEFELIFEGVTDDTLLTLQKLKGIFIADLDLSVPEVQNILTNFPVTIKKSSDAEEIKKYYELLKKAGAKVLLVGPASLDGGSDVAESFGTEPTDDETTYSDIISEFQLALGDATENEEGELSFSLDEESLPEENEEKSPTVFSLDLETEHDLAAMALDDGTPTTDAADSPGPPPETPVDALLLDLGRELPASATLAELPEISKEDNASVFALTLDDAIPEEIPAPSNVEELTTASPPVQSQDLTLSFDDEAVLPETQESGSETQDLPASANAAMNDLALGDLIKETFDKAALKTSEPRSDSALEMHITEDPADATPKAIPPNQKKASSQDQIVPLTPLDDDHEFIAESVFPRTKHRSAWKNKIARKVRPYMQLDILLPILIGTIVLGIGNWMFVLNEFAPVDDSELTKLLPDMDSDLEAAKALEALKRVKAEKPLQFRATNNYPNRSISISIIAPAGQIERISFSLSTPRPADLTAEQIVKNQHPPPWLREVVVPAMKVTMDQNGELTGESLAKAYIDDLAQRKRIPAKLLLRGKKLGDFKYFFHVAAFTGTQKPSTDKGLSFVRNVDGTYNFYISGDVEVSITPEAQTVTPQS